MIKQAIVSLIVLFNTSPTMIAQQSAVTGFMGEKLEKPQFVAIFGHYESG